MQDGELPPLQADGDGADRCRPAGAPPWTGAGQQQSSRPAAAALDRPAAVGRQETTRPAAAAAQTGAGWGLTSRRRSAWPSAGGRGLLPLWASEGKDGDEPRALLLIFFVCESL